MYMILLIITLAAMTGCATLKSGNQSASTATTALQSAPGQCVPRPPDADPQLIKAVQARLTLLGYSPGPIDGVAGDQTQEAIRQYEKDHKLLQDGMVTPELLDHIKTIQRAVLKDASVNI